MDKNYLPRKMPSQARSKERVNRILDCAADLLEEKGIEGVTTDMIAERAGVSVGSLYQFFPNKNSLIYALAERQFNYVHSVFLDRFPKGSEFGIDWQNIPFIVNFFIDGFLHIYTNTKDFSIVIRAIQATPELKGLEANYKRKFYGTVGDKVFKNIFPRMPTKKLYVISELVVDTVYTFLVAFSRVAIVSREQKILYRELKNMIIYYIEKSLIKSKGKLS